MAVCLTALKRPAEAEPLVRQALEGYLSAVGESHNKTLITMANLAYIEEDLGHLDEAERLYRRVIEVRTRGANPNEPELLAVMNNLAMMLVTRGDAAGAATVFADLKARAEAALPKGHFLTAIFTNNYGACLTTLGRYEEARPMLEESLAVLEKALGDKHDRVIKGRTRLDRLNELSGGPASVRPLETPAPSPVQHQP
jgi:tetratricopeptide (TPR) repeat protein